MVLGLRKNASFLFIPINKSSHRIAGYLPNETFSLRIFSLITFHERQSEARGSDVFRNFFILIQLLASLAVDRLSTTYLVGTSMSARIRVPT